MHPVENRRERHTLSHSSKITCAKIVRPFAAANINFGGSGTYTIPVRVKRTQEASFIKGDTRLD